MKYKNGLSLRLKESLITRLFLSPKLKQDLDILSYNTEDLLKVLHDIAETNPFIDLKYTNANTTTLDWVQDPSQDILVEYLIKQIQLSAWSNNDKKLVTFLIYKLDNNGYLRFTCKQLANEIEYSEADIQNAKNLLHELSPLGVGAYDLNECLLIQAKKLLHFNPIALAILEKHLLERLADTSSWNSLPWKKEKILEALKELRKLEPTPGAKFDNFTNIQYLIPDLIFEIDNGHVLVKDSKFNLPEVVFNEVEYTNLKGSCATNEVEYFNAQKKQFMDLQLSLERRQKTLIRLGEYLAKYQLAYLKTMDKKQLKALNMNNVAQSLGLSVSTISRAVKDKYFECNNRIISLKIMFMKSFKNNITAMKVTDTIERLINEEDKSHPLSDQDICDQLLLQGINISRRAVTKYRTKMNIQNSYWRKLNDCNK